MTGMLIVKDTISCTPKSNRRIAWPYLTNLLLA